MAGRRVHSRILERTSFGLSTSWARATSRRRASIWSAISPPGFVATRCNVVGPSDGGLMDCTVEDIFVMDRTVNGATVTLGDLCEAFLGP